METSDAARLFDAFCPRCKHFERHSGACSQIHENVAEHPDRFLKKCNGKYFILGEDYAEREDSSQETAKSDTPTMTGSLSIEEQLRLLFERLEKLEARVPKSKILDRKFWTRCWAIWGHNLVPSLMLAIGFYALVFIVAALIAI
jgi:hypothetical protein